jgi:hypothetical protein
MPLSCGSRKRPSTEGAGMRAVARILLDEMLDGPAGDTGLIRPAVWHRRRPARRAPADPGVLCRTGRQRQRDDGRLKRLGR